MPQYYKASVKLTEMLQKHVREELTQRDYVELYDMMGAVRVVYESESPVGRLGAVAPKGHPSGKKVIYDYDSEEKPGRLLEFTYNREGVPFVTARWYLREEITPDETDITMYRQVSDTVYILVTLEEFGSLLDYSKDHDSMTGMLNASGIQKAYHWCVDNYPLARYIILYTNIQNFKYINERYGTKAGDEAIVRYSAELMKLIEEDEGVCRVGGDNFVFFVKEENVNNLIHRLSGIALDDLLGIPDRSIMISAWIGMSSGDMTESFRDRMEHAGVANSIAKSKLRQPLVIYSEKLRDMMNQSKKIIALFVPAIKNHEFVPFFQAKVNMSTGELVGFESLCRWIHEGKFIYPDQFIPVIDRQGLTHEMDIEILRLTCDSIKKWKRMGLNPPPVSVNISRKDIFVDNIENEILAQVLAFGIEPSDIEIEITETSTESEFERIVDFTKTLKEMGFRISIDDFGTGYSSLALIHNICADVVKIDKSFVSDMFEDRKSEVLVESIIDIARKLGMEIIAEGVETSDEGTHLLKLGCATAQGFYYSRPSDFDFTTDILKYRPYRPIMEN